MKELNRFKITNKEKEREQIKEAISTGIMRKRLYKLIGEMVTDDLRIIYNQMFNIKLPTAEELMNEVNDVK